MANLTIKELIDAMKSQASGMNDQERKRNDEKISNLESMSGEDTKKLDEIQKTNAQLKKTFGKEGDINKSLQEMIKFYKTSDKELKKHNKELLNKVDNLLKPQDRKNLGESQATTLSILTFGNKNLSAMRPDASFITVFCNKSGNVEELIKPTCPKLLKAGFIFL